MKSFGFSKPMSIDFPSINFGIINQRENISQHEIASLGFGYGLTASPIQIARAFSIFANDGVLKDFVMIKGDYVYEDKVLDETISNEIIQALELVVQDGTGTLARSDFAKVVGKTGTTHKVSSSGDMINQATQPHLLASQKWEISPLLFLYLWMSQVLTDTVEGR